MCLTQVSEGIPSRAFPVDPRDRNDDEWTLLAPLIPTSKPHGRPRSSAMRVRPPRSVGQKGQQPMYQPDFSRKTQAAEEHVRELQQQAERQHDYPDDLGSKRRTGRSAYGAPWVLWLVLLLIIVGIVVGIVGYLLLNR